ncbi:MAG TPA: hypothetical protein VNF24_04730 [Candidatus Acidoferrales bacterium]|nr:hypothetical protein [Candidatus Acidoferrales bacterium]
MDQIEVALEPAAGMTYRCEGSGWSVDQLGVLTILGERDGDVYEKLATFNASRWISVKRLPAKTTANA